MSPSHPRPRPLTRRTFLRRTILGTALTGTGTLAYATCIEKSYLTVRETTIASPRWPREHDGFRIAHLTDLHYLPWTTQEEIQAAVTRCLSLQPDLIVLTGDYVSHRTDVITQIEPILSQLRAPHGVYASLGNHDFVRPGVQTIIDSLQRSGLRVLRNQGLLLPDLHAPVFIAGLDDAWHGRPDLRRALKNCPTTVPALILMHQPDIALDIANDPRAFLQFSGHSHGGQVRLPFYGALHTPRLARIYQDGYYRHGQLHLYVSRGIGCTGLPLRFCCPPEIGLITLCHGKS
jgi:uncharacterized protein